MGHTGRGIPNGEMKNSAHWLTTWVTNVPLPDHKQVQAVLPLDLPLNAAASSPPASSHSTRSTASPARGVGSSDPGADTPAGMGGCRRARSQEERDEAGKCKVARLMVLNEQHEVISRSSAWDAGTVGYLSSAMVQITLPHSDPGKDLRVWARTNGYKALMVMPGYHMAQVPGHDAPQAVPLGYPFGSIPRLILAWVGREAKRTKSRHLVLGASLSQFMRELGYTHMNGGERGSINRVRDQIQRLFSARIVLSDNPTDANVWTNDSFQFADRIQTWWAVPGGNILQASLFESRVDLSQRFFDEIMSSPVPLDMRALRALKQSPMALDIYCWVTYRASSLRHPGRITWRDLHKQFGSGVVSLGKFVQQFREGLKKVNAIYPQAKFDADDSTYFTLYPSSPSVPRRLSGT